MNTPKRKQYQQKLFDQLNLIRQSTSIFGYLRQTHISLLKKFLMEGIES